jgi:hypothetical protein
LRAEPDEPGPWGELPLLAANSAWSRADGPEIRKDWQHALRTDRLLISPIARLEIRCSARNGQVFDGLAEELSTCELRR